MSTKDNQLCEGRADDEHSVLQDDYLPSYQSIASLPIPLNSSSSSSPAVTPEYPSVISVPQASASGPRYYVASTGTGTLTLIRDDGSETNKTAEYELNSKEAEPFLIRAVNAWESGQAEVVLSRTVRTPQEGSEVHKRVGPKYTISYELVCVSLDLETSEMQVDGQVLTVAWRAEGEEFPTYVEHVGGRWIVGAGKNFSIKKASRSDPVEGHLENAAPLSVATSSTFPTETAEVDYPYAWSQTKTSINFSISNLPSQISPSRDIVCLLRPNTLTLQLHIRDETILQPILKTFLRNGGKDGSYDWWDRIKGEDSTWTWEKEKDPATGKETAKLELTLEKANEGVKWPQLFAPSQENEQDEDERSLVNDSAPGGKNDDNRKYQEIEVPETMSEEDRAFVKASLEGLHQAPAVPPRSKYAGLGHPSLTGSIQDTAKVSGHGEAHDRATAVLPGLLREEIEDEDDGYDDDDHMDGGEFASLGGAGSSKAGKETVFTYVERDASAGQVESRRFAKTPSAFILSRSFKGSDNDQSVVVKAHVDGNLYTPPTERAKITWKHAGNNPAISFVLASKRDTQYVYHMTDAANHGATIFAFESKQAFGLGGNLYIYWTPVHERGSPVGNVQKSRATEAKQTVVKFGDSMETGQLMGVKLVLLGNGHRCIVGLTEKSIVTFPL
jgi:hypothetical protein